MQVRSLLAAGALAVVLGLASDKPAEAGGCRGYGPCGGPPVVNHYVYYPWYRNQVYYMATFGGDPYPYAYVPRGYWPRYNRPYGRYARRYWARRDRGCCAGAAYYPVPAPMPVPVERGYLK